MKCPVDNEMLVMTERNGVEIDYCPKCRGVWLDRGELDKIIERSESSQPAAKRSEPAPRAAYEGERERERRHREDHRRQEPPRYSHSDDDRYGEQSGNPLDYVKQALGKGHDQNRPYKKKRESFLGELFDF